MKRWLWLCALGGLALAGPCAERPYTLETEDGLLGGENLSYDGEVLVFEGRACLEREGVFLQAPSLRYQEGKGFWAEGLEGEAEGWRLSAQRLEGRTLYAVRLEKERLRAQVESLLLENPPLGQGVFLQTPSYRVRAKEARFQRREVRLKGFLATSCPCGEDLRLAMEEARFDPATGELLGEARLGLWGLEAPLGEARANVNRRPALESPLVLGSGPDGGWTLGLRGLPLPRPGEEVGAWERRLTLLGQGLGTEGAALVLGLREGGKGAEVRFGSGAGVRAFLDDVHLAAVPTPPDPATPSLEALYRPTFRLEGLTVSPFARYAATSKAQGLTLGAEGEYRFAYQEGPFSLELAPYALLTLYPGSPYAPYAALGLGLRGGYQEGDLGLRAEYAGRLEPLGFTPPFAYEKRGEFQRLSVSADYLGLSLGYTLENPLGNRIDRLEGGYRDPALGTFRLAYLRGSQEEIRFGYAMPLPDRACCQAFWLAPELGLSGGGLSRYGLTFRYYDGCFAYELRAQTVLKGQYGEAQGPRFSFGLFLR